MASRAHLLSGLRTGGPQVDAESPRHSPRYSDGNRSLKADAAPFTPGSGRMASPLAMDGQADLATLYGASHGQPQQQQDMTNLIRQRQAQMLQQQLMNQQQHQQQQQMEMYRLHAASQQQQHLQEVAVQQRLLLAQMQAEYQLQQQEQAFSAQDQRKAAQASIQASLRQRQADQMYAQLLSQHEGNEAQVQQQQLLQQLQLLQLQAATMQNMHDQAAMEDMGQSRRNNISRTDSPNSQQARRDRQASHAAAESATSWRSTSLALPKQPSASKGRGNPSIVVDDSGSDKSEGNCSDNETPETSEEDIGLSTGVAKESSQKSGGSSLLMERRTPSNPPRPIALSLAPRSRNLSAEVKLNSSAPNGAANNASRQPRGPPTEFIPINFHTRLSARTRREAMSKLCASPRAASFATAPRTGVVV